MALRLQLVPLLVGAVIMAVGGATAGVLLVRHLRVENSGTEASTPQPQLPCVATEASFMTPSAAGSFVPSVDQLMTSSPFHVSGQTPPSLRPAPVRDFVEGRVHGYLAAAALQAPFRQEEDAQTRALHYQVGPLPTLPLTGPIVLKGPPLLEIYVTHMKFTSGPAALAAFQSFRSSTLGNAVQLPLAGSRDQAVAYLRPPVVGDGEHERTLGWGVLRGQSLFQFVFQGGSNLPVRTATTFVEDSLTMLASVCGGSGA